MPLIRRVQWINCAMATRLRLRHRSFHSVCQLRRPRRPFRWTIIRRNLDASPRPIHRTTRRTWWNLVRHRIWFFQRRRRRRNKHSHVELKFHVSHVVHQRYRPLANHPRPHRHRPRRTPRHQRKVFRAKKTIKRNNSTIITPVRHRPNRHFLFDNWTTPTTIWCLDGPRIVSIARSFSV